MSRSVKRFYREWPRRPNGELTRQSTLEDLADDFPADYFKAKVLPELIKSVEFGGGGPKVFSAIMKISSKLTSEEYQEQLVPVIVRLFSSPDRALRVTLLEDLPLMIDHLSQKIVSNNIFPQIVCLSFLES
jgi:SCY1-like protein 1